MQKDSLRAGFEPARETPLDFKSNALTTRPSQLLIFNMSNKNNNNKYDEDDKDNTSFTILPTLFLNSSTFKLKNVSIIFQLKQFTFPFVKNYYFFLKNIIATGT